MKVDFATFCYSGDMHRLHAPEQLEKQVDSNLYPFDSVIIVYQKCRPDNPLDVDYPGQNVYVDNLDEVLELFDIDLNKPQYASSTDKHHTWKQHVVNHLAAVSKSSSDYIVFADIDCWIIAQPRSWVSKGIEILTKHPEVFLVSPNDGERERITQVISQQMFMVRTEEFRNMDFNQPGWDGNPHVPNGPLPEYWGMLEGRIALYCKYTNRYRYVLDSEYRYWHHNRIDPKTNMFITDTDKYV